MTNHNKDSLDDLIKARQVKFNIELANSLMVKAGFSPEDNGPYVTELRRWVLDKVMQGMRNMSAGTWVGDALPDAETRAKAILGMWWSVENGYSYKVANIDGPPWGYTYNITTNKKSFKVRWRKIPSWLGDKWREALFKVRKPFLPKNPYK